MMLSHMQVSKLTLLQFSDAVIAFCCSRHWHFGRYAQDMEKWDTMCCKSVECHEEELEARSVPSTTLAGENISCSTYTAFRQPGGFLSFGAY